MNSSLGVRDARIFFPTTQKRTADLIVVLFEDLMVELAQKLGAFMQNLKYQS
jgi:hypothetical protein